MPYGKVLEFTLLLQVMKRPFRFGVMLSRLPKDKWIEWLRKIESLDYSTVFCPDHFGPQWEPVATLAAAAAVTKKLHVGSLVYCVDYRHPVVLAKAAATIHLLSGGRHEFGVGAGWMKSDYKEAGISYDPPSVRIERLDEALKIIRLMWTQEKVNFSGKHYKITEIAKAIEPPMEKPPRIIVGGGGRKLLTVAGRHADIVGIHTSLHEGKLTPNMFKNFTIDNIREKIVWVRKSAKASGRNPDNIELCILISRIEITNNSESACEAVAKKEGLTIEEVKRCPQFLIGSASEIQEQLKLLREKTGISYIVIPGSNFDLVTQFAESVIRPLHRSHA